MDRLSNALRAHVSSLSRTSAHARFATISSVNNATGNVRVVIQPDGVLSGWLPVLSPWVGAGWGVACPLSPGDPVLVVPHEGDLEQGVVVGAAFSKQQMPPNVPQGELWLVHRSGSSFKLCNDGVIRIQGDMHVDGNISDKHGPLDRLRSNYDKHVHIDGRGAVTSRADCLDE